MSIKQAIEALLAERNELNEVLARIGDMAHHASTGPAVPDKLWEIRGLAYDHVILETDEPAALAALRSMPESVQVPKRPTQAMRDVMDSEGWAWEDLLAAAEAITEDEHAILATPPTEAVRMSEAENWRRIYPLLKDANQKSKAAFMETALNLQKQGVQSIPITEAHAASINASNALTAEFEAIEQATAARLGVKMGDV